MGLGVESRVVIIRNPYTFPRAKDFQIEIQKLAEANLLVLLLQSGRCCYPVEESSLPENVHIIRFSYYEGEEDLLEQAKCKVAALLSEIGIEVAYDVMPVLFHGAYFRLPENVQLHVVQSVEDYQTSDLVKVKLSEKDIEAAKWLL